MEVVVFADTPLKPVAQGMLDTLVHWDGPLTVLTSSSETADTFRAQRTKPFTRVLQRRQWSPDPLPPMTLSVEHNLLSVLEWKSDWLIKKMKAFQEVAHTPQSQSMLFLLSTHGIRSADFVSVSKKLHQSSKCVVLTGSDAPVFVFCPADKATWFFETCLQHQAQSSQDLFDALSDAPLTRDVLQTTNVSLSTFQGMASETPEWVEVHDVKLAPSEFGASAVSRFASAYNPIPVNATGGTGTAWLFFGLVAVSAVFGVGMTVGRWRVNSSSSPASRWSSWGPKI